MKKIILSTLLIFTLVLTLIGCAPINNNIDIESPVYTLHKDCINTFNIYLLLSIEQPFTITDSWLQQTFIESYIKLEEDEDFEIYIHLKYENKLAINDEWFYLQVLGGEISECKKTSSFVVHINMITEFKHTNKIDQRWQ